MRDMANRPERTESNCLTRKQREAIPHLIGARSLEEGRRKAGVSKNTLYTWLKDEKFKAELDRLREEVISDALDRLKRSIADAVEGLTKLMSAKEKNIKIRACERVLEFFFRAKELEEIEARLSELEKSADIIEKRRRR
jgi:hypothetical protein